MSEGVKVHKHMRYFGADGNIWHFPKQNRNLEYDIIYVIIGGIYRTSEYETEDKG